MAKIILETNNTFAIGPNASDSTVYGAAGSERVILAAGSYASIDQNVERTELSGASSSYTYAIAGNKITVNSGVTPVATIIGGNGNKTIAFSDGSATLALTGLNKATLGGQAISTTGGTLSSVTLNTADKSASSIALVASNLSLIGISADDNITGGSGDDILSGDQGNDTLMGGEGSDDIQGGDGADSISGQLGDDTLSGDQGNDTLMGGEGSDDIQGGDGLDSISGDLGDDFIFGNQGNDSIDGGEGSDDIQGGAGSDSISGGLGIDTLTGGDGNDTFSFNLGSISSSTVTDIITDFVSKSDKMGFGIPITNIQFESNIEVVSDLATLLTAVNTINNTSPNKNDGKILFYFGVIASDGYLVTEDDAGVISNIIQFSGVTSLDSIDIVGL